MFCLGSGGFFGGETDGRRAGDVPGRRHSVSARHNTKPRPPPFLTNTSLPLSPLLSSLLLAAALLSSKGYNDGADCAHQLIPRIAEWGASAVTLHGRTRQQRYSREADWAYIGRCAGVAAAAGLPLVGNGDVLSYDDWRTHMEGGGGGGGGCDDGGDGGDGGGGGRVTTCMVGRGALIKPWVFTGACLGPADANGPLLFVESGGHDWGGAHTSDTNT